MGYFFSIRDANIVAYLTCRGNGGKQVPRIASHELFNFLGSLYDEHISATPPEKTLISSDSGWIASVKQAAAEASRYLTNAKVSDDGFFEELIVERASVDLRRLLSDYNLFALIAGSPHTDPELDAFVRYAAFSSGHRAALFLVPLLGAQSGLGFLDPFPFVAMFAEQPQNWPGVLFWSRNGKGVFVSLKDAYDLYGKLRPAVSDLALVDQILEEYQTREAGRRILHLSDLHFGTEQALEHEAYLSAHLESIADSVDRVVITGDLFNQPRREEALAFRNFRAMLTRNRKEDIIVIPGNHDQKWLGNFGAPLREAAKLEWSSLVVDDELQCVFLCFNSSLDADFARGKVTVHQLREMGTAFETQCICRPAVRNYLRIALVHHHPFSFETAQETWIARALSRANLSDEYFLRMDDAESFLKWCARRGVPLLLHGHKHVPRYVTAYISPPDGENWPGRRLTAVGCGTSLGAEGKPLSYNLVRWDSHVQSWTVSFFADPGDGSGFTRQYVAVHAVSAATSE